MESRRGLWWLRGCELTESFWVTWSFRSESLEHDTVSVCRKATAGVVDQTGWKIGLANPGFDGSLWLKVERCLAEDTEIQKQGARSPKGVSARSRTGLER